jgi:hypothetical protein
MITLSLGQKMGKFWKDNGNKLEKFMFFYTIEGFFLGTLWIFGLDPSTSQPWIKGFKFERFP